MAIGAACRHAEDILETIYQVLQSFRAQGLEPPAAIGITPAEWAILKEAAPSRHEGDDQTMTIWGHPVVMVQGPQTARTR